MDKMPPLWRVKLFAIKHILKSRSLYFLTDKADGASIKELDYERFGQQIKPAASFMISAMERQQAEGVRAANDKRDLYKGGNSTDGAGADQ